jgi:hypothetical protein
MKFITALVSWILLPIAIVVVAYDIAKCFVESKVLWK